MQNCDELRQDRASGDAQQPRCEGEAARIREAGRQRQTADADTQTTEEAITTDRQKAS